MTIPSPLAPVPAPSPIALSLTSSDGLPLRGWCYGSEPSASTQPLPPAPLLLLHGFANDSRIWDPIASRLALDRTVYALDFRGHGDSAWDPAVRYDHATLAADVDCVVRALGLQRNWILVGHSLGARVGLLYQQTYRPSLAGLAILDTGPEIGAAGVARVRRDAEAMPESFEDPAAYLAWLKRSYILADPVRLAAWATHNLRRLPGGAWQPKTDPAFTRSLWRSDRRNGDASDLVAPLDQILIEALQSVDCPTLLLRGQMSAILRQRSAERMVHDWLGNGRLVTIPGAGHALPLDQPRTVATALADFLSSLNPAMETADAHATLPASGH